MITSRSNYPFHFNDLLTVKMPFRSRINLSWMTSEQKLRLQRFTKRWLPLSIPGFIALFPIFLTLRIFRANWTSVPYGDEWSTPGSQIVGFFQNTLRFSDLYRQHNESRLFFPTLYDLFLATATGRWESKDTIVLLFTLACVGSFLLYLLLLRTTTLTSSARLWAWALLNAVVFCPAQYEEFLWGIFFVSLTPGVALLAAMAVNISDLRLLSKVLANSSLAMLATYSFSNGMLLWLLAVPMCAGRKSPETKNDIRNSTGWYLVYFLVAAVAVGLYFRNFRHPAHLPQFTTSVSNAVPLFHFLLRWLGNVFVPHGADPLVVGCLSLTCFAGLTIAAIQVARRQGNFWRFYPWITIAAYGFISGAITASGRLGFGPGAAVAPRYFVVSVFFYVGLAGLAISVSDAWKANRPATSSRQVLAGGLVVGLFAGVWLSGFSDHVARVRIVREQRRTLALAVRWIPVIADNPDLVHSRIPAKVIVEIATALSKYDVLRPPFVSEALASTTGQTPPDGDSSAGRLTSARFNDEHRLLLTGTAWIPYRKARADCVVVGYVGSENKFTPFTVFKPSYNQEGLKRSFDLKRLPPNGFAESIDSENIPMGDLVLRAWAVDLRKERAFPMAGAIAIHNEAVEKLGANPPSTE